MTESIGADLRSDFNQIDNTVDNKGTDAVNIGTILKHENAQLCITPYFKIKPTPSQRC
jgi:hypothetical protein